MKTAITAAILFLSASAFANVTLQVDCYNSDCLKSGWTVSQNGQWMQEISCINQDCENQGWNLSQSNGYATRVTCDNGGCFKIGWTEVDYGGTLREISCQAPLGTSPDCMTGGWVTRDRAGFVYNTICRDSNCATNGWDTFRSDGSEIEGVQCRGGNCFENGWIAIEY